MTGGVVRLFIVLVSAAVFTALPALVSVWQIHAQEFSGEGMGAPALDLSLPSISSFAPATDPSSPLALQTGGEITLTAKLIEEGEDISRGLVWRIFGQQAGPDGKLPLIASAEGGSSVFQLAPGGYLVHASYGRAGATKRITVGRDSKSESLVLDAAGQRGVQLQAAGVDADGERALIIPNVSPNSVVRLNSGVYHIVSTYGAVNAVIRSDIRIEAGKLTEATVEHHAAELTMKLVREPGGEAIADTSWSVLSGSGDPVREVVGAFASLVLAEGDYTIIAKNKDRIYQRDFTVVGGRNQDVEVLATEANSVESMDGAD